MIVQSDLLAFEKEYLSLEATSVEQAEAWITQHHAKIRLAPAGQTNANLVARFSMAQIGEAALAAYDYRSAMKGELLESFDAVFFCVPVSGSCRWVDSQFGELEHRSSQVLVYRPTAGLKYTNSSDYKMISLIVPANVLESHLSQSIDSGLKQPLMFSPLVPLDSDAGRIVLSLIRYLMAQAINLPHSLKNPIVSANMTAYLSSVLLSSLPHNYSDIGMQKQTSPQPAAVKRAEDYMREMCAQSLTVEDLARVAGCSPRALHTAFRTFKSTTPMARFCELRLEAAHHELLNESRSVREVAEKFGFSNQGRFARKYAQKYGQKPSHTQRLGTAR